MSKRKRRATPSRGLEMTECQESIKSIKSRIKNAKRDLSILEAMVEENVIHYDLATEVIGHAYLIVVRAEQDLARRSK